MAGEVHDVIEEKISSFKKNNETFSIIIFDIDSFKNINDNYGHLAGDKILQQIAIIISQNLRKTDWLFRWGGDEFIILLSKSDLNNALLYSNKIEKLITNHNFFKNLSISISCGFSQYHENNTLDNMLATSDKRMYKSKNRKKLLINKNIVK